MPIMVILDKRVIISRTSQPTHIAITVIKNMSPLPSGNSIELKIFLEVNFLYETKKKLIVPGRINSKMQKLNYFLS